MLRPFRLIEPNTASEAATELGRLGEAAKIYAGGAELILLMRTGVIAPEYLVNVKRIAALGALAWDDDGTASIGATVTHRQLETDPQVRQRLPLLAEAESVVGNPRVRCQGTLGGNLCFADPHADPGTALLVHEASVEVAGPNQTRRQSLDDFLVGTYETALTADELLTTVRVPPLPEGWGHAYQRIEQFHRPTLNVAAAVSRTDGHLAGVRLAVGCVGPRPLRLTALEERLPGLTVGDAMRVVGEAQGAFYEWLDPVDDVLGSAEYKVHLTVVLLRRALEAAAQRADGKADRA